MNVVNIARRPTPPEVSPLSQAQASTLIANVLAHLSDGCSLIDMETCRAREILRMSDVFVADYVHDIGKARE